MFTIYKASAGSGKTSRLVVEYLALCLPDPNKFRHILAVTFTNNATAEMKSRIVNTLSHFAFNSGFDTDKSVCHIYNQIVKKIEEKIPIDEPLSYIKNQAKLLLEKILYEYDRFSICTIDTLFQRIVRAFALEFGLSAQFRLEISMDEFFRETISILLHRLSKDNKHLTRSVLDLVENNMFEKGKWKIENDIIQLLKLSMDEEVSTPLKKLQQSENKNFDHAKKIINSELSLLKARIQSFTTKNDKMSEGYKIMEERVKELAFFGKNLYKLALLFDLRMIMEEIKSLNNLFFLSETNVKICEKLCDDDVPFIYEKIGNQYSYFFIDEFQDTSKLQWQNLIPLIKNALSEANKFNEHGEVFLFGDVKQAIYRFRNGDANILQQLSNIKGYRDAVLPYAIQNNDYRVEWLDANYRSSKNVVEFNNDFFSYLTSKNGMFTEAQPFYEDVMQKVKPAAEKGMVGIYLQEKEDGREFKEFLLEPLLEITLDALRRGYTFKDMAVLVTGNDTASKIGGFLISNHLPVISTQSLQLSVSPEVKVVFATLQYLLSEEDQLAKLEIVQYLSKRNNLLVEDQVQYVKNDEAFQHFLSSLNINIERNKLRSISLLTLLHEIIGIYALSISNPFLVRLLDECEAFLTKRNGTILLFVEWWNESGYKLALSTPPGMDAITVSTIHRSKGLEYPLVIFPFNNFGTKRTKADLFVQDNVTGLEYDLVTLSSDVPQRYQSSYVEESNKTAIDHINLMYVAHTRAEKELHIIGSKKGIYSKYLAINGELNGEWRVENREWVLGEKRVENEGMKIEKTENNSLLMCNLTSLKHLNTNCANIVDQSKKSKQQLRGIFIHQFLSALSTFPQNEKEIELLVENVDESYRNDLGNIFRKILNDNFLLPFFTRNLIVLNESSILFPDGNQLRPDRVVFVDGIVVVIDYKTGEPCVSHQEQINRYCDAISKMGYERVEGYVLYI